MKTSNSRRGWVYSLLFALALFSVARLYYRLTDDFRLGNMTYDMHGIDLPWKEFSLSPDQKKEMASIFQQKFSYIGKGAQCYAFVSEDQQYVLKFFKFKHMKPSWFVQLLPSIFPFKQYKESTQERKRRKLYSVFEGYELAYQMNKEDSELLYVHLKPTQELNQSVTVLDKLGFAWHINLDEVVFLLQRKGETLRTCLNRQLKSENVEGAKESVAKIIEMYVKEYTKGIYDRDHGVMHNTGFVEGRPFHLDVGKMSRDERIRDRRVYKDDLEHVVWKIDKWVKLNYPHHYELLSRYLAEQYQAYTGERFDLSLINPDKFKKRRH